MTEEVFEPRQPVKPETLSTPPRRWAEKNIDSIFPLIAGIW